jgi:GTPase
VFVDRVEIEIIAGKGGDGCRSFRREKHVPHGGPNGGDGGHGGSIIIRAREGVNSLMMFSHQKQWRAERGMPGTGSNCHGKSGDQLVLEVPPGTVVMDLSSGLVIKDLVNDGSRRQRRVGKHALQNFDQPSPL